MKQFKYTIRPIHGKENPADALKRLQLGEVAKEFLRQTEDCALTVVTDAIPAALLPRQVERESELDPTLQLVHEALTTGDGSPREQQWEKYEACGLITVADQPKLTTLVNAKCRWSIQLHVHRSKGKNAFKGSVDWNQWYESKNLQDQVSDHCDRMSYTVFTDEAMSYRVINWATEIIEVDNELLVLKMEQIDWQNYIGKMGILLQHLRIA